MARFEPWSSSVRRDRSVNCVATTALNKLVYVNPRHT